MRRATAILSELNAYLTSVQTAIEAVPGVRQAALTSALPLEGAGFGVPYTIDGREAGDSVNRRRAFFKIVSPSYFDALQITRRAGRTLSDHDTAGAPPVVLINETLARREFPDEDPIGRRLIVPEIVAGKTGVRPGGRLANRRRCRGREDHGPWRRHQRRHVRHERARVRLYSLNLIVRTDGPPRPLQGAIRLALDRVNRDQALSDVRTLEEIVDRSTLANRVVSQLFALFASIALMLAAVGIYGVMSILGHRTDAGNGYSSGPWSERADTCGHSCFGAACGSRSSALRSDWVGTFALTRAMSSMLYGVGANDPLTIGLVAVGPMSGVAAFGVLRAGPSDFESQSD